MNGLKIPGAMLLLAMTACSPPQAWWEAVPGSGPPARLQAGAAFDAARQRVVMFGGIRADNTLTAETWEFDGHDWALADEGTGPTPRSRMAVAWDRERQETLVFGGFDGEMAFSGLWAWNGKSWRYVEVPGPQPSERFNAAMAADPVTGNVVLFGGTNGSVLYRDTWEWNGHAWRRVDTDGPDARHGHTMAADPRNGRVLLFGGLRKPPPDTGPNYRPESAETWAFRGGTWERVTGRGPSPRALAGLAREQVTDRVFLYGGSSGEAPLADLWELEGDGWREIQDGDAVPPPRYGPVFMTSPNPRTVFLYGGSYEQVYGDTWLCEIPGRG